MKCLLGYTSERLSPTPQDGSFETWICHRFGRRLFGIFFKTYSEKLWGLPCGEWMLILPPKGLSNFLFLLQYRVRSFETEKAPNTNWTSSPYPVEGAGMVYRRMAEAMQKRGGELHLKTPVQKILVENGKVAGVELLPGRVWLATT